MIISVSNYPRTIIGMSLSTSWCLLTVTILAFIPLGISCESSISSVGYIFQVSYPDDVTTIPRNILQPFTHNLVQPENL